MGKIIIKDGGGVYWCRRKSKNALYARPFAQITQATNDLIVSLWEEHKDWKKVYDAINFDEVAKKVVEVMIKDEEKFGPSEHFAVRGL